MATTVFDPLRIPVTPGQPFYDMTTTLDGTVYTLALHYSTRLSMWFMDVGSALGVPLLSGLPLVPFVDLMGNWRWVQDIPPGVLMVIPQAGDTSTPGLSDMGLDLRCELVYFPTTEE